MSILTHNNVYRCPECGCNEVYNEYRRPNEERTGILMYGRGMSARPRTERRSFLCGSEWEYCGIADKTAKTKFSTCKKSKEYLEQKEVFEAFEKQIHNMLRVIAPPNGNKDAEYLMRRLMREAKVPEPPKEEEEKQNSFPYAW